MIEDASVSFVVTGTHNRRWVGYMFADTGAEKHIFGEDDDVSDGGELDEDETSDEDDGNEPNEDFLPSDGRGITMITTENTIQDPRTYFLHVVGSRMHIIVIEWDNLVHVVGGRIAAWVRPRMIIQA